MCVRRYYATTAFCAAFTLESLLWIISAGVMDSQYDNDASVGLGFYFTINVRP